MPHPSAEVESYLDGLVHPLGLEVRALRDAILSLDDRITERIKWKAPSFVVDGVDRVTFALRPGKGIELILHRGVAVRSDTAAFRFDDDSIETPPCGSSRAGSTPEAGSGAEATALPHDLATARALRRGR